MNHSKQSALYFFVNVILFQNIQTLPTFLKDLLYDYTLTRLEYMLSVNSVYMSVPTPYKVQESLLCVFLYGRYFLLPITLQPSARSRICYVLFNSYTKTFQMTCLKWTSKAMTIKSLHISYSIHILKPSKWHV
jgi:hypothetical protein